MIRTKLLPVLAALILVGCATNSANTNATITGASELTVSGALAALSLYPATSPYVVPAAQAVYEFADAVETANTSSTGVTLAEIQQLLQTYVGTDAQDTAIERVLAAFVGFVVSEFPTASTQPTTQPSAPLDNQTVTDICDGAMAGALMFTPNTPSGAAISSHAFGPHIAVRHFVWRPKN